MRTQFIQVAGEQISYLSSVPPAADGDRLAAAGGSLFVFVHDVGENARMWRRQLELLDSRHAALAIDLPGHGDCPNGVALGSIAECVEYLGRFVQAMQVGPFVLVGKGLGASIALHYGAAHTRRVRGLVLISAAAKPEVPAVALAGWADAVRDRSLAPFGAEQFSAATSDDLRRIVRAEQSQTSAATRYRDLVAWTADDFRARLTDIRQPVLVIAGADDRIVPPETSQDLCPQLPNARMEVIDGAGHVAEREQADLVTAKIEEFVGSLHREH